MKSKKFKNTTFLINTLNRTLYVVLGAAKSKKTLTESDTLLIFISIDEARLRAEEPEAEIYTLGPKDDELINSDYAQYQIIVLKEKDLVFDAQYTSDENGKIRVAVLLNKTENSPTNISVLN